MSEAKAKIWRKCAEEDDPAQSVACEVCDLALPSEAGE